MISSKILLSVFKPRIKTRGNLNFDIEGAIKSGTLIKDDNSTRITYIHKPFFEQPVIIKEFKFKGYLHSILRSITNSRAKNYWKSAKILSGLGIETPSAIAMQERKFGLITINSYIVTKFYSGYNAKHLLENPKETTLETIDSFSNSATEILSKLFKNNITHGDTKVPNFMIGNQNICIIDLDVMRINSSMGHIRKYIQKDIARFERDWKGHPYEYVVLKKTKALRELFLNK